MPGKNGGPRPGSGRPVGSLGENRIKTMAIRKRMLERFEKIADKAFNAMEDLALGVVVMETDAEGKPRLYRKPPEKEMLKELIQQIAGKPTMEMEIEHTGTATFIIERAGDTDEIAIPGIEGAIEAAVTDADDDEEGDKTSPPLLEVGTENVEISPTEGEGSG